MAICLVLMRLDSSDKSIISHEGRHMGGLVRFSRKMRDMGLLLLMAAPLCVLSALRKDLGTDYFNYTTEFIEILGGEDLQYESGYLRLARWIGRFWYERQAIIAVTAVLFCGIVFFVMYKQSKNICFSLFIFFFSYNYFISLNNVRQCLAQAVALLGICALLRGRKILFVVFALIAGTIHQTAVSVLLVGAMCFLNIKGITLLFVSLLWFVWHEAVLQGIIRVLLTIESYLPRLHGISFYLSSNMYMSRTVGRTLILFDCSIMLLIVIMESVWLIRDTQSIEWKVIKYNQFLLLMVYGLDGSIPAVYRIARLFSFAQFVYLPNLIARIPEKKNRILAAGYICLGLLFFFAINYMRGAEGVFPYRSILGR